MTSWSRRPSPGVFSNLFRFEQLMMGMEFLSEAIARQTGIRDGLGGTVEGNPSADAAPCAGDHRDFVSIVFPSSSRV